MNKIIFIVLGIFLISFTSATIIYSGECLSVNLSEMNTSNDIFYIVVGNSSNLEGLNVELNGTEAIVCTVINFAPDTFTLMFIDNISKIEKEIVYLPGHSHTKIVNNTIIKEVPTYIIEYRDNNTIQYIENKTIEEIPVEIKTNKIPLWLWIIIALETGLLITLILILAKKKSDDENIELKGGKKENGKNNTERNETKEENK